VTLERRTSRGEIPKEGVPERRRLVSALKRGARAAAVGETPNRRLRLHAQQKLDLAELVRLKAAGRVEPLAKAEELERRHRFQDVELRHHDLEDRQDPFQRVLRRDAIRPPREAA
jgi:hypothetical protein